MSRVVNRIFERKADIGIDMGNTNSYAWVSVGGRMRCVVAPDGGYHFPSYVYFRKDGSITVGSAAKRLFGSKTQSVVTNAMGLIGRMYSSPEVQSMKDDCGCPVVEKKGNPVFYVKSQNRFVTPLEVCTEILRAVIEETRKQTDCEIGRICVTISVNSDENQRSLVLQAVLNCGFRKDQVKLLYTPLAITLHYGQSDDMSGKTLLVLNVDRHTSDVSIVKEKGEGDHVHYEVCKYKKNDHLGEADIDAILLDWIIDRYREATGNDLIPASMDEGAKASFKRKLLALVERAKIDLSTFESSSIELTSILPIVEEYQELVLTRTKMNDLIRDKVSEILQTVKEALEAAKLSRYDIDAVLLTGESLRMDIYNEVIGNYFHGVKINDVRRSDSTMNNDYGACGACLALEQNYDPDDITAYSLDYRVDGNEIQCIIPVNSKLPAVGSTLIYTSHDYIDEVKISVFQSRQKVKGDTTVESNGVELATIHVTGFPLRPSGEVTMKLKWDCPCVGVLDVTVLDVTSNYKVLLDKERISWYKHCLKTVKSIEDSIGSMNTMG